MADECAVGVGIHAIEGEPPIRVAAREFANTRMVLGAPVAAALALSVRSGRIAVRTGQYERNDT